MTRRLNSFDLNRPSPLRHAESRDTYPKPINRILPILPHRGGTVNNKHVGAEADFNLQLWL